MIKQGRIRVLTILLILTMVISLCGCNSSDSKSKETDNKNESMSILEDDSSEENVITDNTKPTEETNNSDNSSDDNGKVTWTNAGWASELDKNVSGDYAYVTNKKQTINTVKGSDFSMTTSDFTVGEWEVIPIGMYINGNPEKIYWKSEDPSVAQVIDNELVGIYEGTTKISGTCDDTTVHITVTVEKGWNSADVSLNTNIVNLYPGESFQLIASERNVEYASADSGIAEISSDGKITGVKEGTTIITATHNDKKAECKVIIAENGSYLDVSEDTKYTVTKERVLLATDRTFIILDAGVVIEDNLLDNIEAILTKIEKVTGYSYTDANSKVADDSAVKRVVISVCGYGYAYSDSMGVTIAPYDITVQECGAQVLVHELIHTVQHRNTVNCGNALTEGFAEYCSSQIYNDLPFCKSIYDEEYNSWTNLSGAFGDVTFTADNMEGYLVNPLDSHPTSYFFVKYLVEKYGISKVHEIHEAITDEFIRRNGTAYPAGILEDFTEQDIFDVIKSVISADVAKEFYTYFNGLEAVTDMRFDMSDYSGEFNQGFTGNANISLYKFNSGDLTLNGPLVIDFTHALDYAKKIYGRKVKGLNVRATIETDDENTSDVLVTYYDWEGKEVAIPDDFDYYTGIIKAVSVKVNMETAGIVHVNINSYHTFDQYYE